MYMYSHVISFLCCLDVAEACEDKMLPYFPKIREVLKVHVHMYNQECIRKST